MSMWTNGERHLQACEVGTGSNALPSCLRTFGPQGVERSVDVPVGWKSEICVAGKAGNIFLSNNVYSFDTLQKVAEYAPVSRLDVLPDGRFAWIARRKGKPHVLEFGDAVNQADISIPLAFDSARPAKSPVVKGKPNGSPGIQEDAWLRVNQHGIAVSDGQTGTVAVMRHGQTEFEQCWQFPAHGQAELHAEATPKGALVVSRFGARESSLLHLTDKTKVLLKNGYSMRAVVVGDRHALYYDFMQNQAVLVALSGKKCVEQALPALTFDGLAGANTTAVLGCREGVVQLDMTPPSRGTAAQLKGSWLPAVQLYEVWAQVPEKLAANRINAKRRVMRYDIDIKSRDDVLYYYATKLDREQADTVVARLARLKIDESRIDVGELDLGACLRAATG